MKARSALLAGAAAALAVAGCGSGGGTKDAAGPTQTTTRVEVIRGAGGGRAGFDPTRIYRDEAPGVVTVISDFGASPGGGLLGGGGGLGQGSGFVISGRGEIATNAHVVTLGSGRSFRRARAVFVQFPDGNQVPAKIVGADPNSDVGLIRVDPGGLTLRPLALGVSAGLTIGTPVAAIGSPFGEQNSLSVGIISGTNRTIDSLTKFQISGAIQTDAAINHGNSGGPLVDGRGRVLGINSQIASTGGGGEGVGFAVPIDTVRRSLAQLRRAGHVSYAYLGISTVPVFPQLAKHFHLGADHGAWLQKVEPGGPAAKAGLKAGGSEQRFDAQRFAVHGDVIVAVDGRAIRHDSDVATFLTRFRPGQRVTLDTYRSHQRRKVTVTLAERPATVGRAAQP